MKVVSDLAYGPGESVSVADTTFERVVFDDCILEGMPSEDTTFTGCTFKGRAADRIREWLAPQVVLEVDLRSGLTTFGPAATKKPPPLH